MYKKIVVPLDGSPLSEAELLHAEEFASLEGVEVIDITKTETLNFIQPIRILLQKAGICTSLLVREGSVSESILKVCKEKHAGLIAMSPHGRSGVSRWLMGSVSAQVFNHSPVPVLLIRPHPK